MILRDLIAAGCESADGSDMVTDGQNEYEREAAEDLLQATTDRAAAILLDQFNGALAEQLRNLLNNTTQRHELS